MRPFESYMVYIALLAIIIPYDIILYLYMLSILLHIIIEFPRWQFIFLYILPFYIYCFISNQNNIYLLILYIIIALAFILASSAIACLMPIVKLPSTNGKYRVGMVEHHIRADRQNFLLRIFYPTLENLSKEIPYFKHGYKGTGYFAKFAKLPSLIFSHMTLFKLSVIDGAIIIDEKSSSFGKKLPLIIFSHGLGGTYECYSTLILELASHGYIVAVPLHHDKSASYVEFPDGQSTLYQYLTPDQIKSNELAFEFRNNQLKHRAHECRIILNVLSEYHSNLTESTAESLGAEKFFGRIDLQKVAIAGHSFGIFEI